MGLFLNLKNALNCFSQLQKSSITTEVLAVEDGVAAFL